MNGTDLILREAARLITRRGLHTGAQFAAGIGRYATLAGPLDICAAVYVAATGTLPDAFFTNEVDSLDLIEASEPAMAAIKAISAALDTEPCETNGVPDYIEHVSNWAATPGVREPFPPTTDQVIGRILRAADQTATTPTAA